MPSDLPDLSVAKAATAIAAVVAIALSAAAALLSALLGS